MSLKEKSKKAKIKYIIQLINEAADKGYDELDLSNYDFDFDLTDDMFEEIKAAFNEDELQIHHNVVSW